MGKKGTKRKTRWKALPLAGEDASISGNESDVQDEDVRSTSSSSGRTNTNHTQPLVVRMGISKDRSRHRRFPYDSRGFNEPLVKLESKTFDDEEYTKVTTPRQDVLFKKKYFGRRKIESSMDENPINEEGKCDEAGPMEQIIITNGFVDERGHYLVNGSSYEIYDPYTNTVTVVVGPPPYATGQVTPPVLAAVSCQPVPLQPVEWFPTAGTGDWTPPGPAWTPAYPPVPPPLPPPAAADDDETGKSSPSTPDASQLPLQPPPPAVFTHPPPPFLFSAAAGLIYPPPFTPNGLPIHEVEPETIEEESIEVASTKEDDTTSKQQPILPLPKPITSQLQPNGVEFIPRQYQQQQSKESHSTQTCSKPEERVCNQTPNKESHSTQTVEPVQEKQLTPKKMPPNKRPSPLNVNSKNVSVIESTPSVTANGHGSSPRRSYAKTVLNGLESNKEEIRPPALQNGGESPKIVNGSADQFITVENRRNFRNMQNGYHTNTNTKNRTSRKDPIARKNYEMCNGKSSHKQIEDSDVRKIIKEPERQEKINAGESDKSSTISELSSPTDLSSGQNTPCEKKTEENIVTEINNSEKLKEIQQNEQIEPETTSKKPPCKKKKPKVVLTVEDEEPIIQKTAPVPAAKQPKAKKKKRPETTSIKEITRPEIVHEEDEDTLHNALPEFLQPPKDELEGFNLLLDDENGENAAFLRSLRVSEERVAKVRLNPDMFTMMMPMMRPKIKLEDYFTRAGPVAQMRATRPEEFFASVLVDSKPASSLEKSNKKEERKPIEKKKTIQTDKEEVKKEKEDENLKQEEDGKLGIVEAVTTWLQSQKEPEKVLSTERLLQRKKTPPVEEDTTDQKNVLSNPLHAPSVDNSEAVDDSACSRVAELTTHTATPSLSPITITHLPDSPPITTLLTDARSSVDKYYTLVSCVAEDGASTASSSRSSEAFDALEYKFDNASVSLGGVDSGVQSDLDVDSDGGSFPKDLACKLQ